MCAMINAVNEFLDDLRGGRMTEAPIVRVAQGELQGQAVKSPSGKTFYSFKGVPYAKPPIGSLRFRAPQPPEPWEGVRDATSEGNVSAQIDSLKKQYVGDENCLFLNVYTPNLDGEFLPVMVYIHGGGFRFGSGNSSLYGGDYLVEKDVVVVTLNYRCGALGFLCLNTPEVPGNAGLKDIVQAIRWVKENIGSFGGNAGNLTVFGESCGGIAASLLTASPLTKNLISKVIIQSGTGLNSWALQDHPIQNARDLSKLLGCESEEVDDILEFLTTTPVRDIVETLEKLHTPDVFYEKRTNIFAVVVEKEFPGVEAVLTESFSDLLSTGRIAEMPVMIGSTTLEFTVNHPNEDLQIFIPKSLNVERNSLEAVEIANRIKELYFKGNHTAVESLDDYFHLLSDALVNIDTHRYVQLLVQVTNKPVYYYKFDYVGELNLSKKLLASLNLKHASHMDELGYLFKNEYQHDVTPTSEDVNMRERMLMLWTNFAKSGNPTPEENQYITATWLPVTKDNLYYLKISNELSLDTNPDKQKMEFWDDLYRKHYKIWEHPPTNTEEVTRKTVDIVDIVEVETQIQDTIDAPEIVADIETVSETKEEPVMETKKELTVETNEEPIAETNEEPIAEVNEEPVAEEPVHAKPEIVAEIALPAEPKEENDVKPQNHISFNGNGVDKKGRTSNEIKMVHHANGHPKDVIRANDPPEDDLPKNIGVNKFVNFFESLGGKK